MANLYDHNYELILNQHIDSLKHMRDQVYFNMNYLKKDPISDRRNVLLPALTSAKGHLDELIATYCTARLYLNGSPSVADVMEAELLVSTVEAPQDVA